MSSSNDAIKRQSPAISIQTRPISYAARRQDFFSRNTGNYVAIVPAHPQLIRNDDVPFKFRQDSTFRYLTGFDEPDSIAVFRCVEGIHEFVLFVRPKDLEKEIWTGFRAGVEGAQKNFGADRAYSVDEFEAQLGKMLVGADRIYYGFFKSLHRNGIEWLDEKILRLLEKHRQAAARSGRGMLPIYDLHETIAEMRIFKAPEEIERLKIASQISAKAHTEAMARCRPGLNEYQIEALLEYIFREQGCERYGYPSIVAGGAHSTILHYVENNRILNEGDLLLIDAGGEFDSYTSDITRTFAVSGKFSAAQREIYSVVLDVQKECIRMARPGVTLAAIHNFAVESLTDAMVSLGLLQGDRKKLAETSAHRRYYPHGTGHFLGMDVHDIGISQINGEPRKLEPGMVFTVEPGLYVLSQDTQAPVKYRGLGVRIEDDILITSSGCEVLTSAAPKEIQDLESLVGSKPWVSLID